MEKKYKVFYQGSLYGHFGRDRAGKEIEINKSFLWGGESWLVPSVYICGKGLVADILKSVSVEDFRAFAEKFGLDEADDPENFSPQRLAKAEAENPLGGGIYVTAKINGRESSMEFSSSDRMDSSSSRDSSKVRPPALFNFSPIFINLLPYCAQLPS